MDTPLLQTLRHELTMDEPLTVYLRGGAVIKGTAGSTDDDTMTIEHGRRRWTVVTMTEVVAIERGV
jgi:hypothetical protein